MLCLPGLLLLACGGGQFGLFRYPVGASALLAWGLPGRIHPERGRFIAILGGADARHTICVTSQLAPHLLGPIARGGPMPIMALCR